VCLPAARCCLLTGPLVPPKMDGTPAVYQPVTSLHVIQPTCSTKACVTRLNQTAAAASTAAAAAAAAVALPLPPLQVFSFIVYDMIEQLLVRRGIKPTVPVRLAYRTLYVAFTAFVACLLPFFGDIMVSTLSDWWCLDRHMWHALYMSQLSALGHWQSCCSCTCHVYRTTAGLAFVLVCKSYPLPRSLFAHMLPARALIVGSGACVTESYLPHWQRHTTEPHGLTSVACCCQRRALWEPWEPHPPRTRCQQWSG
jgi:hypothetical protein